MKLLLVGIIVVLAIVVIVQQRKIREVKRDLSYITNKLQEIMGEQTTQQVQLSTPDVEMRAHLQSINELLKLSHQNYINYNKSRASMKRMLANISHDLKTPLTVVLGYLEIMQLQYKEDKAIYKTYIKVQEVLALINKFFDLAKLESGDKEIPMEKVDLSEICRMSILDHYATLENDGFEVEIYVPEESIFILGNKEALERILDNLISNAIKYGSAGKYLGLRLVNSEESVNVQVIDKGKGIAEKYKEEVFERMYTLEDSRSKTYQGSGLGLTITKELVEVMGGEIHLESEPYKQTIFSFKLPKQDFLFRS